MKAQNYYKSLMILSALLGVACLGAWGFIIYESFSLKGEIISLSAQADSALARDAKTLTLKSALRDSRASVALIDGRFIQKEGIPDFIDLIETKAENAGVKASLDSVNLDKTLYLHVTGSGLWRNLVTYVSVLESLPYAVTIDNLSFSRVDGSSGQWNINLDLVVLVVNQ